MITNNRLIREGKKKPIEIEASVKEKPKMC